MPNSSSSANWLLVLIGLSFLMAGFGFSLKVVRSQVAVEED
jgi:hypothetical protein